MKDLRATEDRRSGCKFYPRLGKLLDIHLNRVFVADNRPVINMPPCWYLRAWEIHSVVNDE
jgi:hypothetical protein